jgi:hypothetical protein
MKRSVAVAAAVTAGSAAFAPTARALEGEQHLGVDTGPSVLVINNKSTPDIGVTLGGHYSYSLSDAFNFVAEGAFSLVALGQNADDPKQAHTYPAWVANADVGVAYVFDVLRWVPYAGLLVGAYDLSGATINGMKILPGAELALGLDYRWSPTLSFGVAVHEHFLSAGLFARALSQADNSTYPSFTQVLARAEYVWGW